MMQSYSTSRKSLTKDASRRSDPFASRRIRTFNLLYADERRCMQMNVNARTQTQTHADERKHEGMQQTRMCHVDARRHKQTRIRCKRMHADARRQTQTHAGECRCMQMHIDASGCTQTQTDASGCAQTNAEQTVSSVWADTTSRCVWTLDVCSRTFGMYYSNLWQSALWQNMYIHTYIHTYIHCCTDAAVIRHTSVG